MTEGSQTAAAVVSDLAPNGRLRVALNHGNVVLVRRGPTPDAPIGVTVALAREIASRLGLPLDFLHFDRAADVSASARDGVWDLCFLAVDPKRSTDIVFSEPYVAIDGAFLVPAGSPVRSAADPDRLGQRVGAVRASAYALHLERARDGLQLILFESADEAVRALGEGRVDTLAGVRQAMDRLAAQNQGLRVVDEPFMSILQALGVPAGRPVAAAFVRAFVDEAKATGFVAKALEESGQSGIRVP